MSIVIAGADPNRAILNASVDSVLAIIANVDGPSYRPLGAEKMAAARFRW